MEFCYEMPVWMSLGFIFFLARSISIDKFYKRAFKLICLHQKTRYYLEVNYFCNINICSCLLKSVKFQGLNK